jgi:DNA-binding MarR family transcriptional regulator
MEMVLAVRATAKKVKQRFEEEKLGISLEQHYFLMVLSSKDEFIQSDLAELMEKDKSAVMRHIDALEAEKFVVRINDTTDRRKKFVVLTKPGMEKLEKANALVQQVADELRNGIDEKDMEAFRRVLKQVHGNAEK